MDIIYLGHSCFKISGKDATVVTDPFDSETVGIKFPKVTADIVTVSHNHPDHNFLENVENPHKIISGPGEYEVRGISILGFPSFHDNKKGDERGENTIYVFEVDGTRIAHLGDLGHILEESTVTNIGNIDVLLVPIGGNFTIDPKDAVAVTRAIEPKIVVPMHYRSTDSPEMFSSLATVDDFVKALGTTPEKLKKLSIKPGSLTSEEMKLVILEK